MEPALHHGWKKEERGNGGMGKDMEEGEERRALVTDGEISRGWEAPVVMVVAVYGAENHAMRTCGFCFLIKMEKNIISYFLIRHEQSSNSSEVVILVT